MSEWTIAEIRTALVRTGSSSGRSYPEAAQTAALEWGERQRRKEIGFVPIASELGINPTTL
jgi:hypothetical protein